MVAYRPVLLFILIAMTCRVSDTWAKDFVVSPTGPYTTLQAARDAARQAKPGEAKRILLTGGDYYLRQPLALDSRDSQLVIEPVGKEKVTLYGGQLITGWKKGFDGIWTAKWRDPGNKTADLRVLIVNGRMCPRARLPREGTYTHLSEFNVPWMSTTGGGWKRKPTREELTTLKYRAEDLASITDIRNAELRILHMWDESLVGVASNDTATHTLRFSNPAHHPPGAFGVKEYVVFNIRKGITDAGQWYIDRAKGMVAYRPLPNEEMQHAVAIGASIESLIHLRGTEATRVHHVAIRGLTLSVTNTPLKSGGFGAGAFEGAVSVRFADNCCLENLNIVNVGGQGIRTWKCDRLTVRRAEISHTGACGMVIRGTNCVVEDNHVHHVGQNYPSAIGIWGRGAQCTIQHNEVHDTPYSAIISGGEDQRIEHNLIYRAMLQLHDGGGIYISMCHRITLRGNVVRDIPDTGGYGSSAYYLDEQARDCLVEKNLSLRVARPSHNHMAANNTIRNNVFITEGDMTLRDRP